MILVKCVGHIKSSLGREEVELEGSEIEAAALVERLRGMSKEREPGFNKYNTLAMVDDGEAFVTAGSSRIIRDGEKVVLIPFSHGG